jgi:hypothetical protein
LGWVLSKIKNKNLKKLQQILKLKIKNQIVNYAKIQIQFKFQNLNQNQNKF